MVSGGRQRGSIPRTAAQAHVITAIPQSIRMHTVRHELLLPIGRFRSTQDLHLRLS